MPTKHQTPQHSKSLNPTAEEDTGGKLGHLGGSPSDQWNRTLISQAVQTIWLNNSGEVEESRQLDATAAALRGIAPQDVLEGMIAAQMVAAHNATMECYRRAMLRNQSLEGRKENLNQASKLSRTGATLLEALNKHRGKGQQKVTVEHVHVHAGGQAVVGTIEQPVARGEGTHRK